MTPLTTRHSGTRTPFAGGPIAPTIGDWAILETLHEGRFSIVSRVIPCGSTDVREHGYVAKIARTDTEAVFRCGQLLKRELELLNQLDHAHVITILDADENHEPPFFVMPCVGDSTLGTMCETQSEFPLCDVLWISRQIAQGLLYLHQFGVCHLDLKPDNIVLNETGHATLIDLGFAQSIGNHGSSAPIVGTRNYIAPERIGESRIVNPASDVFALGVLLMELLDPSSESTNHETAAARHRRLRANYPSLTLPFLEFVDSMRATIPERRPCTDDVLDLLWRCEIESLQI